MFRKEILVANGCHVYGSRLLNAMLDELEPNSTVLNVGIGRGVLSSLMLQEGHNVIGVSIAPLQINHENYTPICGLFEELDIPAVDAVWSSMTLEHIQNIGLFLNKCRKTLRPNGWLGIVVPNDRNNLLVDGHLSFWTPAHLIYNLVLAGWDCSKARYYTLGRDIALLVQRADRPEIQLAYDQGDLERLRPYFPVPLVHRQTDPWLPDNFRKE